MLAERLQHRVPEVTLNVISWLQSNRHRKEHAADQRYVDQDRAGLSVIQGRRNLSGKEFTIVSHRVGLGQTHQAAFSWAGALLLIGREARVPAYFLTRGQR